MEAKAIAKGVRISPRKVRLVTRLIVGKSVSEADVILSHLNKDAATAVRKVLLSATANAENNLELNRENLYVKEAYVGDGITLKRGRAAAKGSPKPILKRSSHITVVVSERD
ncbi:MAG TPA: 50S ribosomal protein L22 [Candidatus Coprosoma intestinipullorum]|uniref:Large ribosomal subunit protein uL22 n=1 Tax=Candidatus Coprosoma intestinipullorum TaxID=2840752 RepID=A0A9D0ZR79_9FIRM|nr:50S ribosomal protein L22 [Candidatus Coprosoma intestinipullorum]